METFKKDGVSFLQSKSLSSLRGVTHAFLGRSGGVSSGGFASLNMTTNTLAGKSGPEDIIENVTRNRDIAARIFGFSGALFVTARQVHGDKVIKVEGQPADYSATEADAMITKEPKKALAILTADCLPILIYDPRSRAIGAAHAGWRGTAKLIALKTVEAMQREFGSAPADLVAALGPAIGPCCYKVGTDVAEEITASLSEVAKPDAFLANGSLDIPEANALTLKKAGLRPENITKNCPCTACSDNVFFSYRRDSGQTGRQISFIMIRSEP